MNPSAPTTDTIAAIATPVGAGGIGVVRISGPEALWIARRVTRRPRDPKPRYAHLARVYDGNNELIDQALLLFMPGPRSYTGEDVAELSCHGGPIALRRVLDSILAAGARPAGPGEFTLRAFLNGRLDLAQAEAVADLVAAPTPAALAVAANQLAGRLSDAVGDMRSACLDLLAQMEAEVDFDEDEVPAMDRGVVAATLDSLHQRLEDALASAGRGIMQRHGVRVALVGSPNVGKSSLMNALLSTDRAIVTEIPGTTRDVLEESFDLDGVPIVLNDTAGLRETRDPVETLGVERSSRALDGADAVVLVLDASRPLLGNDENAAERVRQAAKPTIVSLNKRDLPHAVRADDVRDLAPGAPIVRTAAIREDVSELRQALRHVIGLVGADGGLALVASVRHQEALTRARDELAGARRAVADDEPSDFISIGVRGAVNALGEITGESATEDLLDVIFSKFCIGK
ncbi:MAG: tRNA uridine-5-carboxymethylaminomethyl(34) synthesis GTPase MnmE [Chloroflexota bacterium]|nr:tRNA uridine-5-carboxymethylaminomethyl(34) synthesis GTPase MnmE [Chloroflexota bacterium]